MNERIRTTRLTGMDQVIWNLTSDEDLFCIWSIAVLETPLRDELIQRALAILIKIIPILHSHPKTNWLRGKWQLTSPQSVNQLITRFSVDTDLAAHEKMHQIFQNPINARKWAMIRLISIDGPSTHYFIIQVHHMVVDGEGLKRICVKFAEIYQNLYRNPAWEPSGILDPNRSWGQIARYFKYQQLWLILIAWLVNFFKLISLNLRNRTCYNLLSDSGPKDLSNPATPVYFQHITLDKESMLALKSFAKQKQATVNDVLMASLSLATGKWNTRQGISKRNWLQFGFTANLRRWWGEPVGTFGNYSVILIHDEIIDPLRPPATTLLATKSKMDRLKKSIGLDGFMIMAQLKLIPYFLLQSVSRRLKLKLLEYLKRSHAMTNIGIIFEEAGNFGHTKVIGYSFLAPTFPGGCTVYTISTYQNMTTIYLACSEDHLKPASALKFLELWKQIIIDLIALE